MNVFTDYAETHWVPINGDLVTVQTVDAAGRRETHVLSVPEALAQFAVKYPFVDEAQAAALFAQGGRGMGRGAAPVDRTCASSSSVTPSPSAPVPAAPTTPSAPG